MRKKLFFIAIFTLVLMTFTGCKGKPYILKMPADEIETIEIVSAENSLEFTVIKTLSETERKEFLEQFRRIEFNTYYIGDPMSVYGDAVKITYQNGDYEMICFFWAEYVKNGEIYFVRRSCDEEVFNNLIETFLEEDINE